MNCSLSCSNSESLSLLSLSYRYGDMLLKHYGCDPGSKTNTYLVLFSFKDTDFDFNDDFGLCFSRHRTQLAKDPALFAVLALVYSV
jgi:hypothetical protein